jgi:hypothetical protein
VEPPREASSREAARCSGRRSEMYSATAARFWAAVVGPSWAERPEGQGGRQEGTRTSSTKLGPLAHDTPHAGVARNRRPQKVSIANRGTETSGSAPWAAEHLAA